MNDAARAQGEPGTRLHAESSGRGTPVVFWHGWGLNLRCFDSLRGALGETWRTTAVDLPGHGQSSWNPDPDSMLPRLLATLPPVTGATPAATLVGWSLGAQFALRAAALAPARIARLVLISATPRFVRSEDWPHGIDAGALQDMQARLAHDYRGTVSDFLELQVRGSRDADATLRSLRAALLRHGAPQPAALAAGLALLERTDLRSQLASIRVPTLVIAGQYDRVTPPAAGAALAALLPQARYLPLKRAAHAPFLSHQEELLPALREFLGAQLVQ